MSVKETLLQAFPLNQLFTLKNKIVMAPMTRAKADVNLVPTQDMVDYYARRADAGLIITEGTAIQSDALGYSYVPGIFTQDQIEQWRRVTDAVHRRDGVIFLQLWHVGRVSHPDFLNGALPISPSATEMTGHIPRSNGLMFGQSRAAILSEIKALINDYAEAAVNAMNAGFDGVEIHGANGYLIDQFLHYDTNQRVDGYGGSLENRVRFALEVVKACGDRIGYERVGLRLSPGAYLNQIVGDIRDADVFKYLLEQLNPLQLAYVHTGNFDDAIKFPELGELTMTAFIRTHYQGTVIASGGYTIDNAHQGLANSDFDLIAIGRPFIANPDLIERIRHGHEMKSYDVSMLNTLY
jgi:N-ethylmaleimide reductase